jgi:hypothetical protein
VQLLTSIWHGVGTPIGANVHGTKQLKRDVGLLHFLHQKKLDNISWEKKVQVLTFIFPQIKLSNSLL